MVVMDDLHVHLQNHWAAATGGIDFADRVAGSHRGTPIGADLDRVRTEVHEDRETLREIMEAAGTRPGVVIPFAARVAERVGRLKPNGHLIHRSPVSDVMELEIFRGAVTIKLAGWETLAVLAEHDARLPLERLLALAERAREQAAALAEIQRAVAISRSGP